MGVIPSKTGRSSAGVLPVFESSQSYSEVDRHVRSESDVYSAIKSLSARREESGCIVDADACTAGEDEEASKSESEAAIVVDSTADDDVEASKSETETASVVDSETGSEVYSETGASTGSETEPVEAGAPPPDTWAPLQRPVPERHPRLLPPRVPVGLVTGTTTPEPVNPDAVKPTSLASADCLLSPSVAYMLPTPVSQATTFVRVATAPKRKASPATSREEAAESGNVAFWGRLAEPKQLPSTDQNSAKYIEIRKEVGRILARAHSEGIKLSTKAVRRRLRASGTSASNVLLSRALQDLDASAAVSALQGRVPRRKSSARSLSAGRRSRRRSDSSDR